jgi:nucleoside-diphosphate-sugar epimerase
MTHGKRSSLILGGSGFVGVNLVSALLAKGHEVTLLNRGSVPIKGTRQLIANRENRDDMQKVASTIGEVDAVIDTSSFKRSHSALAWEVLAEATHHWIHLGTAAVYKEKETGHATESDAIGGSSAWGRYGVDKSEADLFLIEKAAETPVTIFRPPYLYGPCNSFDRETFVWARALQNRPVLVPGDGLTPMQFLHIADLSSAIVLATDNVPRRAAVYNIAGHERPAQAEWVRITAQAAELPNPSILAGKLACGYNPRYYFPFPDSPLCLETEQIKSKLGWHPLYSLRAGLRQTYATQDAESLKRKTLDVRVEERIAAALSMHRRPDRLS